ncbi:MAG: hypothetical protein H6Q23_460 [Bacteroidetes bacterium]|nr:hypothetical protein [Bacteroidota bacterium]
MPDKAGRIKRIKPALPIVDVQNKLPSKKYPTIGVCGLDCGLCPRYYTAGPSRCPGCAGPDFFNKHPSCSFITCCVKKKNLEVCGECSDFPCSKFKSDKEYQEVKESSSYPPYKKAISNLNFIKEYGIEKFIERQNRRIRLLETMIKDFDDGRSRSFFCKATCLLDISVLETSMDKAARKIRTDQIKQEDVKNRAKILKTILNEVNKL